MLSNNGTQDDSLPLKIMFFLQSIIVTKSILLLNRRLLVTLHPRYFHRQWNFAASISFLKHINEVCNFTLNLCNIEIKCYLRLSADNCPSLYVLCHNSNVLYWFADGWWLLTAAQTGTHGYLGVPVTICSCEF